MCFIYVYFWNHEMNNPIFLFIFQIKYDVIKEASEVTED